MKLKKTQLSISDIKREIKLPHIMSDKLAEEIGIHIGDGCVTRYKNSLMYSLRGHLLDDRNYYEAFIIKLYKELFNINIKLRLWSDVIGFQICSSGLVNFKKINFNLPIGPKKEITMPDIIFDKKSYQTSFIRGFFDTDGSLTFEKKSREKPYYPRIFLSTTSRKLSENIVEILNGLNFNLSVWKTKHKNIKWKDVYRICVRGKKNTDGWFKFISSNNLKNVYKYRQWKLYGYVDAPVAQLVERQKYDK